MRLFLVFCFTAVILFVNISPSKCMFENDVVKELVRNAVFEIVNGYKTKPSSTSLNNFETQETTLDKEPTDTSQIETDSTETSWTTSLPESTLFTERYYLF
jgi:hypothetical protein